MSMDLITVGVGLCSFGCFVLVHAITFRRLAPERLIRSMLIYALVVGVIPVALMAALLILKAIDATVFAWALGLLLALAIAGLLYFNYLICVVGPYETSIRIRLLREISAGGNKGVTSEELLSRYNVKTMVEIRLRRLIGSGDVIMKDGRYYSGSKGNFFFVFDIIAGAIKKGIG